MMEPQKNAAVIRNVTYIILVGFMLASMWALGFSQDATIKGSVIGTWTALATTAGGYWLGVTTTKRQRNGE